MQQRSADINRPKPYVSLGTKAAYGLIWTFGEKVLANAVSFVVSLILARLLTPEVYGTVAITSIFINISNALLESGFGSALIQKKNADDLDFNTVFLFEMLLAAVLYLILSISAQRIAVFYGEPLITRILKVCGLTLFFGGIRNVQHAYVSRRMEFRTFFYSTLCGTLISGIAGAVLAFLGYGVWALVAQQLLNSMIDSVLLFFRIRWKPKPVFSFLRLKHLFSYGWKICAAGLLSTIYSNLYGLVIGKVFSTELLALYNKGNAFPALVMNNVSGPINAVTFPVLSACQDDRERLKRMTRKTLIGTSYLLWPVLVGMAASAAPLVELLLTKKWSECAVYLQISAVSGMFWPLSAANGQMINAAGKSDISLKLDILKKTAGLLFLAGTLPFGMLPLAWGRTAGQLIAAVCDASPAQKLISYGLSEQIKDLIPNILANTLLFISMKSASFLPLAPAPGFLIQVAAGCFTYLLCSYLFRLEGFNYALYQWSQIRRNRHDF